MNQLTRFYQKAVELEAKLDSVLFSNPDDEDESHLLRNTAVGAGAAGVGAAGLAAYGRGRAMGQTGLGAVGAGAKAYGNQVADSAMMGRAGQKVGMGLNAYKYGARKLGQSAMTDIKGGASSLGASALDALKSIKGRMSKLVTR
jgi:hypothetical protein